ncbi:hypothetical protein [Geoalkalibacter sp.]|uniref:hypothetical protein n=1 Tax=Geoalkalibacter sp. TaxID=3041440 RepID=UPI00272E61D9|nr:hypothetical protein [Geoalkalibacter sp.]
MTRALTPAAANAAAAPVVRPISMVRLDFPGAILAAHSGLRNFAWGGDTYLGVGHFGGVSSVRDAMGTQPAGVQLTLSGIPVDLVAKCLGDHYQGRDARLYLACLNEAHQLILDPVLVFRGRMDVPDIRMGQTATITMHVENRLADWRRARNRRYSHEDQQELYPGDMGLQFVTQMVEKTILWGRS